MTGRTTIPFDQRCACGPFDIIGDVHGCTDELEDLLARLGYGVSWADPGQPVVDTPLDRRVVFVGDLVDRGPRPADAVAIVMAMCAAGQALCVPGNHDVKFRRWLDGHAVSMTHGLRVSADAYTGTDPALRARVSRFLRELPPYLWLDGGRLVVAHAGIQSDMIGQTTHKIENFCLYGDVDNRKTTTDGFPMRYNWAARYDGAPLVVYGHTCVPEPAWLNNTVCIDTGCCFGGSLTALRYPEMDTVSVPARQAHMTRTKAFGLPPARPT